MIGIYDSGIGGLTVLRHLRRALPDADLLYFGDTARLPYGTRSPELIRRFAASALDYFVREGASSLLVACGTVSTVALPALSARSPIPVTGIVEAAVRAASAGGFRRIAVLGTAATVGSGVIPALLSRAIPDANAFSLACPLFVPLVENGVTDPDDVALQILAERTLRPLRAVQPDAILLACTHFPVLSETICRLFPTARVLDCGEAAAQEFAVQHREAGHGQLRFCVSDNPERFREVAAHLAPVPPETEIELFQPPI